MAPVRILAGAVVLLALGSVGCTGPRIISQDQYGGVIAMPSNSNYWPTYYRSKAEEMMAKKCPQGFHIEHEEEVVVGQSVTNRNTSDTQTQDIPGRKNRSDLQVTTTESTHTTTAHDLTEYRITFRANTAPGMSMTPPSGMSVVPASGVGMAPPPGTLPRSPIPVTNAQGN
jgi:hypothetical protein